MWLKLLSSSKNIYFKSRANKQHKTKDEPCLKNGLCESSETVNKAVKVSGFYREGT